jgi:transcriptional regulator with XRE-family HTH domain
MLYLEMQFRIKEVAKIKGKTLQEMCAIMDISYINFNQQMNRGPKMDLIQKCADALGCSVFELIDEDDNFTHLYSKNEFYGIGFKKPKNPTE